jgi:hypothetical protein
MGKVNQLFQDERQRRLELYLAVHSEADEEMAYDALFGNERDGPEPACADHLRTREIEMNTPKPSKTLQGALIDVQILSNVSGPITKVEQMERLCRIHAIVESTLAENAKEAVAQPCE